MNTTQFDLYKSTLEPESLRSAVDETRKRFVRDVLDSYDYLSDLQVLLYGDVQSGKTSHVLGIIAEALDQNFRTIIVLTSPNTRLVEQTHRRVYSSLTGVEVCRADLTNEFLLNQRRTVPMPTVVVLGKIPSVLANWLEVFKQTEATAGKPILIIDDEGDATSQNTKVNKKDVSRINQQLTQLRNMSTGCIYMQVTGTPQAILLQGEDSGWSASKTLHFLPGENYVGGRMFFDEMPNPYTRIFAESNIDEEINLRSAVQTFLLTCAIFSLEGRDTCNMICHPSHKTPDHEAYKERIKRIVHKTVNNLNDVQIKTELKSCYEQLKETYSDGPDFTDVIDKLSELNGKFTFPIINANSETVNGDWDYGYNLITGGNSLGRGLTFDWLQTVFYVRETKNPQADTLWQHSRMFGYKRHRATMRLFMPAMIAKNFRETHDGNEMIKRQLAKGVDVRDMRVVLGDNIAPTRANVLDKRIVGSISGGVNYFAQNPYIEEFEELDEKLEDFINRRGNDVLVDPKALRELTRYFETESGDVDLRTFEVALEAFSEQYPHADARLVLRTGRKVNFGTGALLSPNDQQLSREERGRPLLILYKIEGMGVKSGPDARSWSRDPIWVPNIKMPEGRQYWRAKPKKSSS